jgi:CubicO group peptidase (beta-lactamase class C family)
MRKPLSYPSLVAGVMTLLVAISGCDTHSRARTDDPFADARSEIEKLMETEGISAYQVAVARGDRILYSEAFGIANVQNEIPTRTDTMFQVASISKPFVSTALMMLVERGLIALDTPVNAVLAGPELVAYRGDASNATIARLLFHTTGLPYGYYHAGKDVPAEKRRTARDLIELCGALATEPGTRYEYTNIGYDLLGEILEETAGENINGFIAREIIAPLGLKRTRFFRSPPPAEQVATQNTPEGVVPIVFDAEGFSHLYSTAEDLVRFGMFHLGTLPEAPQLLSRSSRDDLWQVEDPGVTGTTRRMGWDVQQDFGLTTVQHGGGGPGIHNWLYMIPSESLVIAIMSNAMYSAPKTDPILTALIRGAIPEPEASEFQPQEGRGWLWPPKLSSVDFAGTWAGHIQGPRGSCRVDFRIGSDGLPELRIEGDPCNENGWISPSTDKTSGYGSLLWRLDACIPFLTQLAPHDEVIVTVWPEGEKLIGSASAANERAFGKGESYVLPQFLELTRLTP